MSDITISIVQPPLTTINVGVDETLVVGAGVSFPTHSITHISGGSDELNHNFLNGLQGGSGNQYYHISSGQYFNLTTGDVVRPSETGVFYTNDNLSGFITGVDLSAYATINYIGEVSGDIQSQVTNLNNFTGSYVLDSQTGNFITTNQTGQFYASNNPSGFITGVDLSSYVLNTETGNFITTEETGVFYPKSNPSGFITGVDLSSYATIQFTTGISGELQTQITTLDNQTGSYYPRTNPSGYITGVDLSFSGNYYTKDESESRYVNTTGAETILGDKTFHDKVYINNLYVTGLETIVNTTNTNVASNFIMLNLTGGAVDGGVFFVTGNGLTGINDSGAIIGFDHSDKFKFGIGTRADDLSTLNTIASEEQLTGTSGYLQTQITTLNNQTGNYVLNTETGNFITTSQTGQFYSNSNPSGFITGIDLSSYATQVYVTGISGNLQAQITNLDNFTGSYVINTQTGSFITASETGNFYSISNPSGFITGISDVVYTTGNQTINSLKDFTIRPTINGTGVLISGEGGGGSVWTQSGIDIYYNGGSVGIGTSTPNERLTVSGNISATASIFASSVTIGNESAISSPTIEHIASLTQAEYDSLTPESNTFYIVTDAEAYGPVSFPIKTVNGDYSVLDTDYTLKTVVPATLALPTAIGCGGRLYNFKNWIVGGTTMIVAAASGETIDNSSTFISTTRYESITIQSDGTGWIIL